MLPFAIDGLQITGVRHRNRHAYFSERYLTIAITIIPWRSAAESGRMKSNVNEGTLDANNKPYDSCMNVGIVFLP